MCERPNVPGGGDNSIVHVDIFAGLRVAGHILQQLPITIEASLVVEESPFLNPAMLKDGSQYAISFRDTSDEQKAAPIPIG